MKRMTDASLLVISVLFGSCTWAQQSVVAYPTKPVTTIIAAAPGTATDTEGRLFNQELAKNLGQQFVMDYKPGSGLAVGLTYVARQKPDGYTLLWVGFPFTIQPIVAKDKPYDVYKDFEPVTLMSKRSSLLLVSNNVPISSLKEFVAYAKANPGKLNFATGGVAGNQHLTGLWLTSLTDTQVTYVHYKSISASYPDVLAGRTHLIPGSFSSLYPFLKSGKAKAIGVSALSRHPAVPDLPTVAEQGAPGFEYTSWLGMYAPGGTPVAIVNRLHGELAKIAMLPSIKEKMGDDAMLLALSPADFRKHMLAETARFKKLIEDNNLKFEE